MAGFVLASSEAHAQTDIITRAVCQRLERLLRSPRGLLGFPGGKDTGDEEAQEDAEEGAEERGSLE